MFYEVDVDHDGFVWAPREKEYVHLGSYLKAPFEVELMMETIYHDFGQTFVYEGDLIKVNDIGYDGVMGVVSANYKEHLTGNPWVVEYHEECGGYQLVNKNENWDEDGQLRTIPITILEDATAITILGNIHEKLSKVDAVD